MKICDRDCFNCPYEDCIEDEEEDKALVALDKLEAETLELKEKYGKGFSKTKEYKRIKGRRNYWLHREYYTELGKKYYAEHTEAVKKCSTAWNKAHPERVRQNQREYAARKRAERAVV